MCTTCGCGEGNLYIEGDERNPHSAFLITFIFAPKHGLLASRRRAREAAC